MPHWGIALALGPNINLDVDPEREKAAYDEAQQARALAASAPANERAYVDALVKRYSNDPKADLKALAGASTRTRCAISSRPYPDDLDAATLYAESLMDLHPVAALVGRRHAGRRDRGDRRRARIGAAPRRDAHRREPLLHPRRRGVADARTARSPSAKRLETLVPAAGHLVHMPAHIYMRTGNYEGAVASNAKAAEVDRAYIKAQRRRRRLPVDVLQPQPRLPRVGGDDVGPVQGGEAGRRHGRRQRDADDRGDADARAVRREDAVRARSASRGGTM